MIVRLLDHLRPNVIAYIALAMSFLALGGGAYAAFSLPPNSVGARQIRNHSVTLVKLDPRSIGGAVRHWAQVNADGTIARSSSRARETGVAPDGDYVINWSDTMPPGCVPIATALGTAALLSPATGFANARITGGHPTRVWVSTYSAQGASKPEPFSLAVIC
ncbi:MAG: hypothetical protein ACR2ND_15455 [Solirubrobacteraceae bacterium]